MAFKIEFIPQAYEDFKNLDNSIKKQVAKKIDRLSENPFLGEPLKEKAGIDLTGYYKLYVYNKKYRIIYRIVMDKIEVVEIWGIGRRDKEKIYKLVMNRINSVNK
ncbi:type II toxin-antitoxin system RelE family toxin [Deferribacter abyssi]|uniref:type II toxin-antitoxin system RelE family toxin n=1 Tax=Deferribacter abyssi TaxID=213806 RepID=UPI003C1EB604